MTLGSQQAEKRIRHCMVVHATYPLGETRVEREALALVDQDFGVDVICLRGTAEPATERVEGVQVHRLPVRRNKGRGPVSQFIEYLIFFTLVSIKLAGLHRRRRYHIVQVHNLPDFLIFAAWLPRLFGARLILDLHDLMPEFYAARFGSSMSSWPSRLLRWQERLSCRFAHHVITVTEPWRETLIRRGIPGDKITVVMNVADTRVFRAEDHPETAAHDNERFTLVYHGNITYRYGIDLAVLALDRVRQTIPNIHFRIHGYGDYADRLEQLIKELGLQDHVTFTTRAIPTAELPKLINRADVGVVPYRRDVFTDGILPTKLMEYAALEKPVITARTPAIEAYFDDTMVQFFEPGSADDLAECILSLYKEQGRLENLRIGIRRFNELYSWTKAAAKYVALAEELAGE